MWLVWGQVREYRSLLRNLGLVSDYTVDFIHGYHRDVPLALELARTNVHGYGERSCELERPLLGHQPHGEQE
jgi:hypothetical protein